MVRQQPLEMIYPPNTLKAKVGGNLKSMSEDAIARAEAALASLREEMKGWIEEEIKNLKTAQKNWLADPSNSEARADLYRRLHDLKGLGSTYELPLITRVAASACELMVGTNKQAPLPKELVNAHIEAIKVIARDDIKDPDDDLASTLAGELEKQVTSQLTS